jgi:hypothetical protein
VSLVAEGVKNLDKNSASAEFLANFISALQIALTKIVLSPKNLLDVKFILLFSKFCTC